MLFLKPDGRIDLEHRANLFLRGASHRCDVIAAADDGQVSIISPASNQVRSCRLPSKVRAVSLHPSDRRLASVDAKTGMLAVHDLDGVRLLEIAPPHVRENTPMWIQGGFDDCMYSEDGRFLWTIAPLNSEDVVGQLREAETGATIENVAVKDPFGGSSCSFHPTGKPGLVSLWLAAGNPDMVQVYWLTQTQDGFSCTLEAKLRNTIPPVFSPKGDEFLVVNDDHAICKFQFLGMQQLGSLLSSDNEDNPFVESLCYLNDQQALAGTNEQRIFVVDTVQMKVETEVSLEGHEPRPIGEYYPSLAKDKGVCTDISGFSRMGDVIIFVYRRDRGEGLAAWKDSLLWLSVKNREE